MIRGFFIAALLILSGCSRSSSQTWEDVKTAGRYMQKGVESLFGKESESRMLSSEDDFRGPHDEDFIPMSDTDLDKKFSEKVLSQPKQTPGQFGLPTLDKFYAPPVALQSIFSKVHFRTDSHSINTKEEIQALQRLAKYLKENADVYLVIEGHCDERASASYNMALGMRRANSVRSFLVKQGADLNRIFTISRGKEQPIAMGHSPDDWKVNRRSEFRIYQK